MSTKLAVLKQYLQYVIDNKEKYNWWNYCQCNCGLLLKSINMFNSEDILKAEILTNQLSEVLGFYTDIFTLYKDSTCDVTNLKFTEVVDKLVAIGFTVEELIDLEKLRDTRFSVKGGSYVVIDNLIVYLTNWINYEEQLVKATTKDSVKVTVTSL